MATRSNYSDQFLGDALPVLDALIYEEYDSVKNNIPDIFRIYNTSKWGEQTTTMAGIRPAVTKDEGESVTFDDAIQGYDKTYIPITYAIATSFSEELREDDSLSMVEDTYRSLGAAMAQTEQVVSMNIFNDGFSDTGPDGQNLFDTAHPMIGGHSYGNRPATDIALSMAGLREMQVDLMRQVNHRNINISIMPETLLVPPELDEVAFELNGSQSRPDNANNAANRYYGKYKVIVSPFLTSTTAWFALAGKNQHQLRFYDRVAASTKSWEDEKTGDINTRIRRRFAVGYSDFIGTWGTTG
jgi:hypothetical protein